MSLNFNEKWQKHFDLLSSSLFSNLKSEEDLNLNLQGEDSTFLRFNQSMVRQNTRVEQVLLSMSFQGSGRRVQFELMLTGDLENDRNLTSSLLERARSEVQALPVDPYLVPMKSNGDSVREYHGKLPLAADAIKMIAETTAGVDFAGFYTGGPVLRASRNSKGQKHWFSSENFFVDYSLFTKNSDGENKAIKGVYADLNWDQNQFSKQLQSSQNQLSLMSRKSQLIKPGAYRTYLAPAAVAEILGTMSWNAFSLKCFKQGLSGFKKLYEKEKSLSPLFTLRENFDMGLCPQFNQQGEMAPAQIVLVEKGIAQNWLSSSRSEKEYGIAANGCDPEMLRSTEILPGQLPEDKVLQELGTGLYLGNLHYLNWSDVPDGRITGMTRYAGFWVEKGEVVGPIQDLRFDESLYQIFGSELAALTREQHIDPSISTYLQRDLGGRKNPGALLNKMTFTL